MWAVALTACQLAPDSASSVGSLILSTPVSGSAGPTPSPSPSRPVYEPGELVEYFAQTGDTLAGVAAHFNTTVSEIFAANPIIPTSATTLPPGLPMQVPIYYQPFWGSSYQILPDSLFIDGPAQVDFDTAEFASGYPGWLKNLVEYASGANRSGPQIVDTIARQYSISPRLLLALLEYESGVLSESSPLPEDRLYPLGYEDPAHRGLYLQLSWAANLLNDSYYRWRDGSLRELELQDGRIERPDPWQNAATVAFQAYFASKLPPEEYTVATGEDGLAQTYRSLFGDPWAANQPHIPGSLEQPILALPFEPGEVWAYTGGPHTAWGNGMPYAAIDFAPPAVVGGCSDSQEWATAVAPGVVARSEPATVVLDLDGDGDERTGWAIFYFHLATEDRIRSGTEVQIGDKIGHPSCEGGRATGTHVHIARKYNGEWMPAGGTIPFNLGDWVASAGDLPYQGSLTRFGQTKWACVCSSQGSQIAAEKTPK
jgi:LasA protease